MRSSTKRPARTTQVDAILDHAIEETGFGKYHILLILLVGIGYSGTAMESTVVSMILPAAKCDFNINSEAAGYLTSLPMFGMGLGSFFWGALGDIFGRKSMLSLSLILTGLSSQLSSFSQYFFIFVILRTFTGFSAAGALGLSLPYLGEFQTSQRRERILSSMEFCWVTGIVLVPSVAWLIIPISMRYESAYFLFDSWNAYILIVGTCVLSIGCIMRTFPETPKFLCEEGEEEEALRVLQYMYHKNTGNDPSEYKVKTLLEKQIATIHAVENDPGHSEKRVVVALKALYGQMILLFGPHHRGKTLLACFISFTSTAVYYTLIMWLPEIFTRFQYFEELYPGNKTSVCEVANIFEEDDTDCESKLNSQVYLKSLALGLSCIPASVLLPFVVNKVGFKFFIVIPQIIGSVVCVGILFVSTSTQNMVLSCIFEAALSVAVVTLLCSLVDLFPTNIRVIGSGVTIMVGRFGALVGNLSFGYLIDDNCVVIISFFAAALVLSAGSSFFLPIKRPNIEKNMKTKQIP